MNTSPENIFKEKISFFTQQKDRIQAKHQKISWFRVLTALLGLILTVYFLNERNLLSALIVFMAFTLAFIRLIHWHAEVSFLLNNLLNLIKINKDELLRNENKLSSISNTFHVIEKDHPYLIDMDIFGSHSLFKLVSRAETMGGKKLLSKWLLSPAKKEEILGRQKAVLELAPSVEWRQELQALAMHISNKKNKESKEEEELKFLLGWIKEEPLILQRKWLIALTYISPLIIVSIFMCSLFNIVEFKWAVPLIILNVLLLRTFFKKIQAIKDNTSESVNNLNSYYRLLSFIEKVEVKSPRLVSVKGMLKVDKRGQSSSSRIKKLRGILQNLDATLNPFFFIVGNIFLLWDLWWLIKLEKWRNLQKDSIHQWFEATYEMEALSSLAGTLYANPQWSVPNIEDKGFYLHAESIGHPLIGEQQRVYNDFSMEGLGSTYIITGSNMSGKSTFLRTLGVNAVMAFAGGPVCAVRLDLSVFQVFSSMRTQDSLEENTSSFYAELKRLKQLLDLLETDQITFYMLDEILKGTNSKDRHEGAKALILQLKEFKAAGLVSTHDIELGELAQTDPQRISNFSFNSYFTNGKLLFDYSLHKGVCKSFNASELMKQIGIKIN